MGWRTPEVAAVNFEEQAQEQWEQEMRELIASKPKQLGVAVATVGVGVGLWILWPLVASLVGLFGASVWGVAAWVGVMAMVRHAYNQHGHEAQRLAAEAAQASRHRRDLRAVRHGDYSKIDHWGNEEDECPF